VGSMSKSPRAAKETRMKVLSRATSRPGRIVYLEMVQTLSRKHYKELGQRFMEVFARAYSELPQAELYWRFKLAVGVLTMSWLIPTVVRYAEDLSGVDEAVGHLVAFLMAGLRAPVPASQWQDRAKEGSSS
jgi:Tetracyclin repressor-like, C-terminal domain